MRIVLLIIFLNLLWMFVSIAVTAAIKTSVIGTQITAGQAVATSPHTAVGYFTKLAVVGLTNNLCCYAARWLDAVVTVVLIIAAGLNF